MIASGVHDARPKRIFFFRCAHRQQRARVSKRFYAPRWVTLLALKLFGRFWMPSILLEESRFFYRVSYSGDWGISILKKWRTEK